MFTLKSTTDGFMIKVNFKLLIHNTILFIVGATMGCFALGVIVYICWRKRSENKKAHDNEMGEGRDEDESTRYWSLRFDYDHVKIATNDFSEANILGKGGFGTVYKGKLQNGRAIAVKRLRSNSSEEEFMNEVLLVAKLHHQNLIRLLGYSFAGSERLLIYEFMPNATLDHHLFRRTRDNCLQWHTRYKIIKGIARGLLYLHEDSMLLIIHRDMKAANILLDGRLNPKIADFGMARLFRIDQTQTNELRVVGTNGYLAPECHEGNYSVKSDVYSFGILVLEIITGLKISSTLESDTSEYLTTSVWRKWSDGCACDVVDKMMISFSKSQVTRCIQLGLLCVQESRVNRPTMSLVNLVLTSESHAIPVPSQPAYMLIGSMRGDSYIQSATEEESITELYPR